MKCIINFLDDINQKKIRRLAQSKNDSYEGTLESYKQIFISNFIYHTGFVNNCQDEKCPHKSKCNIIRDIQIDRIENFFDEIKDCYIKWINTQLEDSLSKFNNLLEEYKLIDFNVKEVEKQVLFRGRNSPDILNKWDMFHIPFNKRYLMDNQRYSITGQPMIYLGFSVIGVIEELEISSKNIESLKLSSYILPSNMKIYDLRSNIRSEVLEEQINQVFEELNPTEKPSQDKINEKYTSIFFKNILSSICSFEKRKEHKKFYFCEEYVIPQILAYTLKKNDFDGIRYVSTKKFDSIRICDKDDNGYSGVFKENIALFTNIKYEDSYVYDEELFNKLNISRPIDLDRIEEITIQDLDDILEEIEYFKNKILYNDANAICNNFKRGFKDLKIKSKKYLELNEGKMHINHIYIIMNSILQNCMECDIKK